ncbi:MAG: ClpXP protease specificity-enhancing factor [Gammaproteobacteria bacterium]
MTSTRPYLLRAIYEWIVDNDMTPHLLVEAGEGVEVPMQYVENGVIVLNVSPTAVRDLELGNEYVSFNARFAGTPHDILVPIDAVQAIYARENGHGIFLGEGAGDPGEVAGEAAPAPATGDDDEPPTPPRSGPPTLTVVK